MAGEKNGPGCMDMNFRCESYGGVEAYDAKDGKNSSGIRVRQFVV